MEREVFTLREVEELFKSFVIASVVTDIEDAKADAVWEKYKPGADAGVPHYVVLDTEGNVLRRCGATLPATEKADQFVAFLKGEPVGVQPVEASEPTKAALTQGTDAWPEGLYGPPTEPVKKGFDFEAKFSADKIKPGGEVTLELHFKLKSNDKGEPYHLHHPQTPSKYSVPLVLELKGHEGLVAAGEWEYPAWTEHYDEILDDNNYYMLGEVVVVHRFKVPEDAKPGVLRAFGLASGQYCDDMGCTQFNRDNPDMLDRKFGWVASIEVSPEGVASATTAATASVSQGEELIAGSPAERGFIWLLLAAFGAGIITLLTPCVLPVLPLTIGFFVSQHDKGKSSLLTAFIYCTCIVATFTAFGLITSVALGATGAQNIATNGYVNTVLGIMFLVFALSFLGLFELRVPTFMTQWFTKKQMSAQKEGHGYAKAFFSGAAFSLISFSCTGPIAGTFLAQAATGSVWVPTAAMLAFSTGMALPIFIMGQFPSLMKKMPKSGGWMNAMKVVFGFVEVGLAIMYFSAAEQAFRGIVAAEWISRYVVIAVWASAAVATSLYLFGFFRMPHDHEETRQIGVIRGILAVMFLSFGLYMIPGLFGAKYGNVLEGILPPPPREGGILLSVGGGEKSYDHHDLPWHKDFDEGLAEAKAKNKPVFIDFTGFN
ncbi:MAG: sulfite exporter TauE/SafE family protein [Planctomycetes bacterium]|nr:sulfite exporter TauE/SafE family protein [Planctomycetota bacterium]MCB9934175.1 sulfite exporter TauE/SafE family protein [Planctomycetota bacterium]